MPLLKIKDQYGNDINIEDIVHNVPAIISAINNLCGAMSLADIKLYQKRGKETEEVTSHRVIDFIKRPSIIMGNSQNFFEFIYRQYFEEGNSWSKIIFNGNNQPVDIIPSISTVTAYIPGNVPKKLYSMNLINYPDTSRVIQNVEEREVLAIHNFGFNGIRSPSPVKQADHLQDIIRNATSINNSILRYGIYSRNAFIDHSQNSTPAKIAERQKELFDISGVENAARPALFDKNIEVKEMQASVVDENLIQLLDWVLQEISRIFNVPPSRLNHLIEGTRVQNTLDSISADFVKRCLAPHGKRIMSEFNLKLLTDRERNMGYYLEYDFDSLLRGSLTEMAMVGDTLVAKGGLVTPNEYRTKYLRLPEHDQGGSLYIPKGGSEQENTNANLSSGENNGY